MNKITDKSLNRTWDWKAERFKIMQTAKEAVIDLLNQIPDDSTLEEIQYHLYVRQKIQKGLQDVDQGNVKTQEEVENRMKKWLAK